MRIGGELKLSNIKDLLISEEESSNNGEISNEVNIKDVPDENIYKNNTQKNQERGVKRYMKYEDGKIKYLHEDEVKLKDEVNAEDDAELSFKEKFISFINKEKVLNLFKLSEDNFNIKHFMNILLAVFIIVFIAFVYIYYFNDNNGKVNNNTHSDLNNVNVINVSEEFNKSNNDGNIKVEIDTSLESTDKDVKLEDVINSTRKINSEELNKIYNYIDLKANRASTISAIKKHKEDKENLYIFIYKNQKLIKENNELFQETENLLIKSISMSNEFLDAFNDKSTKTKLNDIIEKYQQ